MKIISWNIRGLGSSVKKRFISKLIKERAPEVLLIQETKVDKFEIDSIRRMWGKVEVDFAEVGAEGASGGLLTMWNKEALKPILFQLKDTLFLSQK